ncbi:structural maintenance of chromosome 3 [Actinidia rufa]|uniref:Structural maintenance of chromosome 3 n=1 Tax=Actinidia rufa TaxID=165716 RepID=A0A7J0EMM0_9ERIC|nr:structural maintenance of chromosome 3 [Actinidia rufa]
MEMSKKSLSHGQHEGDRTAYEDAQKKMYDIQLKIGTKTSGFDCLKEQEALIPLEQAASQKVSELVSFIEAEKSQESVLKIVQAKEMNEIKVKYDVAISTACPGLDYIVVETTIAAQACVELLRRKNLGVAIFGRYLVLN